MLLKEGLIFLDPILIFALAFLIDLVFGEPPDRFQPTVWMGNVIVYFKPKIKSANPRNEKINGCILAAAFILLFAVSTYFILFLVGHFLGWIPYIIVSAVLLKTTFALKGMRHYTVPIAKAVASGEHGKAKQMLHYIVRRDPAKLDERQILSAAVESVAESTTDGVTSPFFYFALFGVPGAFAYRAVNTLDSMIGYKDEEHVNIGWFSAKLDTAANYIPTRLTAVLMVVAAAFLGENWRKSWRTLRRDKTKTSSLNAGWTMSAMAGALDVQLEKSGKYVLGDKGDISPEHVRRALRIMELTSVLFGTVVVCPILVLKVLFMRLF